MSTDVCSGDAPEELYDSPALGSPRTVPAATRSSPVDLQEDIGVGSLVEVATDVDQHYYGVVRWIGIIDGKFRYNKILFVMVYKKGNGSWQQYL